jgi:hypothetical protein
MRYDTLSLQYTILMPTTFANVATFTFTFFFILLKKKKKKKKTLKLAKRLP